MRIVSKVRDYYDVGQGLGYDPTVTYVRTEKEIDLLRGDQSYFRAGSGFRDCVIGFCGKLYRVYIEYDGVHHRPVPETACYTIEALDSHYKGKLKGEEFDLYLKNKKNVDAGRGWYSSRRQLEGSFIWDDPSTTLSLFHEHNAPLFVWNEFEGKIQVNTLLRPWGFYKVFDPYRAYQEIEMYVGGVLNGPVNPIPSVPDEVMVEIKGFHPQWSFRKPPRED